MARDKQLAARLRHGALGAALSVALGLVLWGTRAGDGLERASYDQSVTRLPALRPEGVIIVRMDEDAYQGTKQTYSKEGWDRAIHAKFIRQLREEGVRVVVLDSWLAEAGAVTAADEALAKEIRENGGVVLAGDIEIHTKAAKGEHAGAVVPQVRAPHDLFLKAAGDRWGVPGVDADPDGVVRAHFNELEIEPSMVWVAASLAGGAITTNGAPRRAERWVRYYGRNGTFEAISYHQALKMTNFYKVNGYSTVFIGGKPKTLFAGEEKDEFATPFTGLGDGYMPGVEVQATMFMNLMRGDWLKLPSDRVQVTVFVVCGVLFGFGLSWLRPVPGTLVALGGFLLLVLAGIALTRWTGWWFPWLIAGAGQMPCAWGWAVLANTQLLRREKETLEKKMSRSEASAQAYGAAAAAGAQAQAAGAPLVPDHAMLRVIGKGAYGEVWLARNVVGIFHAVKVVFARKFQHTGPFEREFEGIRNFMPVSMEHAALVRVLHVGRNDAAGYFYYVMELGDDEVEGREFDAEHYAPKTMESERKRRGRFTLEECVDAGMKLCEGLDYLHGRKLAHRDVKPSNIIYVKGAPKFADVGLVAELRETDESRTFLGTPGFVAPEGPGTAQGDVYSMGKVLYQMYTGNDAGKFPELPEDIGDRSDVPSLFRLNDVVLRACELNLRVRYKSAGELRAALAEIGERLSRPSARE